MPLKIASFALAASLSAACGSAQALDESNGPVSTDKTDTTDTTDTVAAGDAAQAINALAFDLYAALADKPGNLAFAPSSISTALAMTYAGTSDDNAAQFARTLHFDDLGDGPTDPRVHAAFANYQTHLAAIGQKGDVQLQVANRLWADKNYPIKQALLDLTAASYGAATVATDFEGQPEPSRIRINGWVADQTADRITDLLPAGSIKPNTVLVLTNAVYFKGDWKAQFDTDRTVDGSFTTDDGSVVTSKLMTQTGAFRYGSSPDARIVELPYKGDDLSMIALLPGEGQSLADLEAKLSPAFIDTQLSAARERDQVTVTLPRFETKSKLSLKSTLQALGMTQAFTFSDQWKNMADDRLAISDAFHQTFIKVDEKGSEAAGATAVVVTRESAAMGHSFRADRPFVYAIRDNATGAILFLGRMTNPTA